MGGLRFSGDAGTQEQNTLAPANALSVREQEILVGVSEGRTNREISKVLSLRELTARNHMYRNLRKPDVASRAEEMARYPRRG
jgi:DNA-binding CsgD family transcriptional regulator